MAADIRAIVADRPTYGYRPVHSLLRRQAEKSDAEPRYERLYRVMMVHGLLLPRDGERREERRHDGGIPVELRDTLLLRGLAVTYGNSEKVLLPFFGWTAVTSFIAEALDALAQPSGTKIRWRPSSNDYAYQRVGYTGPPTTIFLAGYEP